MDFRLKEIFKYTKSTPSARIESEEIIKSELIINCGATIFVTEIVER